MDAIPYLAFPHFCWPMIQWPIASRWYGRSSQAVINWLIARIVSLDASPLRPCIPIRGLSQSQKHAASLDAIPAAVTAHGNRLQMAEEGILGQADHPQ